MTIITLSRQPGSLGDEIARILAEKLGLSYIGDEEIHNLAVSCDAEFKDACELYDREAFSSIFERLMINRPAYRSLFESLHFEIASRGNVIIMGRGGQIALNHIPAAFSVRVIAPESIRIERVQTEQSLSADDAYNYIQRHSRRRRSLIESIFQRDLDDWLLYDIILNTRFYTAEEGADVIASGVEMKKGKGDEGFGAEALMNLSRAKRIESLIRKKVDVPAFRDITVTYQPGGRIVLEGFVGTKKHIQEAEEIAAAFEGAGEVINELRALEATYAYV